MEGSSHYCQGLKCAAEDGAEKVDLYQAMGRESSVTSWLMFLHLHIHSHANCGRWKESNI
jgi:hypothetical protein